jgi:hypothetical protein
MIHAFLLVVVLGGKIQSQDMYFRSVVDCNFFASQVTKRYGNYQHYNSVPSEHKVTAYCKPVKVSPNKELY